jgi:plastocyanin
MKFDITKLPVGEMMIGFLLLALAITFVGAFAATGEDDGGEAAVSETPAESATTAPTGGGNVAITMTDNKFDPNAITVDSGASVTFDLTNNGVAIHNMRIAGPDGSYNTGDDAVSDPGLVSGGQTATLSWDAPSDAGEFIFQCDFHPTDMKGTITVQ